ncbi:MAG: sulfite exporter TauE/SafE family protein [Candidatus Dormibacteraceae bacterium]
MPLPSPELFVLAEALPLGLLIGVVLGLSGLGAGSILTPILLILFHLPPTEAVGTSLLFSLVTKAFGSWQHLRQGTADLAIIKPLALGAVPAALVAAMVLTWSPLHLPEVVVGKAVIGAVLLATALMTARLLGWLPRLKQRAGPFQLILLGVFIGLLVAITSVGSGSITVSALALLTPLGLASMIGSDMVVAALISLVTAPIYLLSGQVDLLLTVALLLTSVPGVILGSHLAARLPQPALKATVLIAMWGLVIKLI